MINSVSSLLPVNGTGGAQALRAMDTQKTQGPSFSQFLNSAIEQVNSQQIEAEQLTEQMAAGKVPDLHSVMIASEKATLSFQMGVQIRNKALEAYQEIMRMQM